jgi:hypothetical protein
MPPVVAAIGWGGIAALASTAVAAGTSIYSTVQSNKQAKDSARRQQAYYNKLAAEQAATEAEEKRLTAEAEQRSRAYGASLLDSGTQLQNMLSGGYNEDEKTFGSGIITQELQPMGVQSLFA